MYPEGEHIKTGGGTYQNDMEEHIAGDILSLKEEVSKEEFKEESSINGEEELGKEKKEKNGNSPLSKDQDRLIPIADSASAIEARTLLWKRWDGGVSIYEDELPKLLGMSDVDLWFNVFKSVPPPDREEVAAILDVDLESVQAAMQQYISKWSAINCTH